MADKQFSSKPWFLPLLAITGVIVFAGVSVKGVFYFSQQQVAPLHSRIEALDRIKPNNFPELEKLAQQQKALIDAENAVRAPWIQALVGILATIATSTAAWIGYQNYRATQEKNTADRFSKAIEQLGNEDSIHVRLGGIFALEQIANTEDKYYWQIMEILTAYVRTRSPLSSKLEADRDIQAVMTVLSRREYRDRKGAHQLDLSDTNLNRIKFPINANLSDINLSRSTLRCAFLIEANLDYSNLWQANLFGARLDRARLNNSILVGAVCYNNTNFSGAFLKHADLRYSKLLSVNFENADLEGANLHAYINPKDCNLQGAILKDIEYLPPKNPESWETSPACGFGPLDAEQNEILSKLFGPSHPSPSAASKA